MITSPAQRRLEERLADDPEGLRDLLEAIDDAFRRGRLAEAKTACATVTPMLRKRLADLEVVE